MTEVNAGVEEDSSHGGLFGRGLLYVVVFALPTISGSVISPVLAYMIGPGQFGLVAAAIAVHQVLLVLAVFGIDQALIIERGEKLDPARVRGLLGVAIVLASSVTVVVALTAPLWAAQIGFGHVSPLVVAVVLWTAPGAIVQTMCALLLSEDRIRTFATVSVLSAVGGPLFGIGLMLAIDRTAATYAWGGVISQFLAVSVGIVLTRPRLAGVLDTEVVRRTFRLALPLALSGLAVFVLNAGDRIIIQRELGSVETGRYQVAYIVGYVVVLLVSFTTQAWSPRFAAARDDRVRTSLIGSARDEVYRLLLPLTLGISLAAPAVLRIVAPASFRPSSLALVTFLVALSAFPVAASGASGRALVIRRRTKPIAIAAGVAAIGNVLLNLVLVPVIGIAGSALATFLAFGLQAVLLHRAVSAEEDEWPKTAPRLWLAVAVTCAVGGGVTLLPQTTLLIWLRFACAALIALPWFVLRLLAARRNDGDLLPPRIRQRWTSMRSGR